VNKSKISYLYIIVCGEYVKVGFAKDVEHRLSTVQVCNPVPVELVYKHPVKSSIIRIIESFIHYKLRQYHVRGEWFKVNPDVVKETINSYFPLE